MRGVLVDEEGDEAVGEKGDKKKTEFVGELLNIVDKAEYDN